jgi:hypothetical protein
MAAFLLFVLNEDDYLPFDGKSICQNCPGMQSKHRTIKRKIVLMFQESAPKA